MDELSRSILNTLTYADKFDYPMTAEEIGRWLIVKKKLRPPTYAKASPGKQNKKLPINNLEKLVQEKYIGKLNKYYFLKGRESVIGLREKRGQYSDEKMKLAQKVSRKLSLIPWLLMVGVTGSLAMKNSDANDDIDLMIVARRNRLWLVRLLIIVLSPVLGIKKRRYGEKDVKDKICFNLFLDEAELIIKAQNLPTAHEVAQMLPIYNQDNIYERFIVLNQWIKHFLPEALVNPSSSPPVPKPPSLTVRYINILLYYTNLAAYWFQYQYMKRRITNEKVSLHQAFFHPRLISSLRV